MTDKILLVTGASSDVGTALIRRIEKEYSIIIAHYYEWNDNVDILKRELSDKLFLVQADFSDIDSVRNMIKTIESELLSPDHIVHFPAPKIVYKNFVKTPWDDFEKNWEVSAHSLVEILQSFLPLMKKKKSGKIIMMLTTSVVGTPPKYQSAYVMSKYALLGLAKCLAVEYEGCGITVNCVSPDMMQTIFLSEIPSLAVEQYAQTRTRKCILNVDEVLPTFEFLLSEGANSITGINVEIK